MDRIPDLTEWQDIGMGAIDDESVSFREPDDWRLYGMPQFGAFSERMGIISGEGLGLAAEVSPEIVGGQIVARTPMLELDPTDYAYIRTMRRPYAGMMALGDDGAIYQYDQLGGFFKRLFKGARNIVRRVRKGVRKVIKKIPGGKYLIKLGEKIWRISNKFIKPLTKFVGKYAAKLAPIAALIPGYGPAIAAGLYTAGKIANLMNRVGATIKAVKSGDPARLVFPSGSKAKTFQKLLKNAANAEKKRQRAGGTIKKIGGRKRRPTGAATRGMIARSRRQISRMRSRRA